MMASAGITALLKKMDYKARRAFLQSEDDFSCLSKNVSECRR
jgi:hypothetical protein